MFFYRKDDLVVAAINPGNDEGPPLLFRLERDGGGEFNQNKFREDRMVHLVVAEIRNDDGLNVLKINDEMSFTVGGELPATLRPFE